MSHAPGNRALICRHCSAPLRDVEPGAKIVVCSYCRTANQIIEPAAPHQSTSSPAAAGPLSHATPSARGANMVVLAVVAGMIVMGGVAGIFVFGDGGGAVFYEWYAEGCLVNTGDGRALDIVGMTGRSGSQSYRLTLVDGESGEIKWRGDESYTHTTKVVCLGEGAFGLAHPDFRFEAWDPNRMEVRWQSRLPDDLLQVGIGEGCVQLETPNGDVSLNLSDGTMGSCAAEPISIHRQSEGYFDSDNTVALSSNNVEYRSTKQSRGTPMLTVSAHRGETVLWTNPLRYAAAAGDMYLAAGDGVVYVYGVDPADDSHGVVVGISMTDGRVIFETRHTSRWSTHYARIFHHNGAYLMMTWGYGLHAYDPLTGRRVWNIGGR